ncbi:DMT family transporter [Balneatrix alpica]|uniref:Guanidinium exporter n=1 Tax=Balneatrix alpica TaxID=75684 RepID=A0ABV5ZDH0_9GAMM|nr:multidrug efflux SMR transporter [Balneatrix alpica]
MNAWWLLVMAGLAEVGFTYMLKLSDGMSRILPTLGFIAFGGLSFWLLSMAIRTIPLSTAYAVWTGLGIVGTVLIGTLVLGESLGLLRGLCLLMLLVSLVGLKLLPS